MLQQREGHLAVGVGVGVGVDGLAEDRRGVQRRGGDQADVHGVEVIEDLPIFREVVVQIRLPVPLR